MDRTLREIARVVGTPLLIDNATTKRIFGHYARILVDMDFSRKLFNEITVEREGYAFNIEVVYKWLPDFCTHCQNIGHDVSVCRWLYPRQESNAHKEMVAQGKKPVPTKKQQWIPIADNPSGIGSSMAFTGPQKEAVPAPAAVPKVIDPQIQTAQQADTNIPILQDITIILRCSNHDIGINNIPEEDIAQAQHQSTIHVEDNTTPQNDIDTNMNIHVDENSNQIASTATPSEADTVIPTNVNSYSMQLFNVIDDIVCTETVYHEPILTPVQPLNVSSIEEAPGATIDPTLRKEMNFMQDWLKKTVETDAPFSLVISKSQKKKLNKMKVGYQTRSQGPLPSRAQVNICLKKIVIRLLIFVLLYTSLI